MSDTDQSLYTLRYNQITHGMEAFGGGTPQWTPLSLSGVDGITRLTGDVTAGPGSGSQAATLATVNGNVGSFTSANITVDAKGRITAAANGGGAAPNLHVGVRDSSVPEISDTAPYTTALLSIAITPAASNSLVQLSVNGNVYVTNPNTYGVRYSVTIFRNGVDIDPTAGKNGLWEWNNGSGVLTGDGVPVNFTFIDSPASTSALTYTVFIKCVDGAGDDTVTMQWNNDNQRTSIIAQEIRQ